jgi:hypothetical protein
MKKNLFRLESKENLLKFDGNVAEENYNLR